MHRFCCPIIFCISKSVQTLCCQQVQEHGLRYKYTFNFSYFLDLQGGLIKKGQVIGYLDQFGTELPVKVINLLQFLYFCDFFSIAAYHDDFFLLF